MTKAIQTSTKLQVRSSVKEYLKRLKIVRTIFCWVTLLRCSCVSHRLRRFPDSGGRKICKINKIWTHENCFFDSRSLLLPDPLLLFQFERQLDIIEAAQNGSNFTFFYSSLFQIHFQANSQLRIEQQQLCIETSKSHF